MGRASSSQSGWVQSTSFRLRAHTSQKAAWRWDLHKTQEVQSVMPKKKKRHAKRLATQVAFWGPLLGFSNIHVGITSHRVIYGNSTKWFLKEERPISCCLSGKHSWSTSACLGVHSFFFQKTRRDPSGTTKLINLKWSAPRLTNLFSTEQWNLNGKFKNWETSFISPAGVFTGGWQLAWGNKKNISCHRTHSTAPSWDAESDFLNLSWDWATALSCD